MNPDVKLGTVVKIICPHKFTYLYEKKGLIIKIPTEDDAEPKKYTILPLYKPDKDYERNRRNNRPKPTPTPQPAPTPHPKPDT